MIKIKRIYAEPEKSDGLRILVDRLWPRGLAKSRAKIGLWMKEISPSDSLRKRFAHDIEKWEDFKSRYKKELKNNEVLTDKIRELENENKTVTLLFSAKDELHNNAVVLREYLKQRNEV